MASKYVDRILRQRRGVVMWSLTSGEYMLVDPVRKTCEPLTLKERECRHCGRPIASCCCVAEQTVV